MKVRDVGILHLPLSPHLESRINTLTMRRASSRNASTVSRETFVPLGGASCFLRSSLNPGVKSIVYRREEVVGNAPYRVIAK